MPTRGKAWKSGVRAEARPESRPCQNGELADSASSSGTWARIRLSSPIASSGSRTPTCTCSANVGSRRASSRIRAVHRLIAAALGYHGLLPDGELLRSGHRSAQTEQGELRRERLAQSAQLLAHAFDPPVHSGGELQGGPVGLGGDLGREVRGKRLQHPVALLCERPVVWMEKHHLLLHAE